MMHDPVDDGMARLAAMPVPRALGALEGAVFAAIDDRARQRAGTRTIGACSVAAALALGMIGGATIGGATRAEAASPIGIDGALAPSTLLLGR